MVQCYTNREPKDAPISDCSDCVSGGEWEYRRETQGNTNIRVLKAAKMRNREEKGGVNAQDGDNIIEQKRHNRCMSQRDESRRKKSERSVEEAQTKATLTLPPLPDTG
ncbi:hypothetical protein E2C01_082860 [Portunus trituberculatus]|uniref:Uncharacterized protein n=1 Tax=Portunus trituberculatus TaxID=210409 RepID=A0A5B7J0E1_PORTR|nr:hypothetical protein [Portunus trituberculatus]